MTRQQELELFESLSRVHRFREWLNEKVVEDTKVLVQALDIDQLRRAQGRVAQMQQMLSLMDAANK